MSQENFWKQIEDKGGFAGSELVVFADIAQVPATKVQAFTFYLGGSRRMEQRYEKLYCSSIIPCATLPVFTIKTTEDTDYDFYATYSPEIEVCLLAEGFDYSPVNEYYLDSECVTILVKDNVQVVLRHDVDFYTKVFENIDLEFYHNHLWKSSPTNPDRSKIGPIFNMLFNIAHATKGA